MIVYGCSAPDMLLKNGAQYVVETKLGAETKLLDAMVRLYDYQKYVTEAKGAFAVLFPEELRRPWPPDVIVNIAIGVLRRSIWLRLFSRI